MTNAAVAPKGARITGPDRYLLSTKLVARYNAGATIRQLVSETGRSYGAVHRMLTERDVTMRVRGGDTRKSK